MSVFGTVKNGMVAFDEGVSLPEGTRVQVEPDSLPQIAEETKAAEQPTFLHMLKFAGCMPDLPADFAAQHDHYIHGTPEK
jgi:hypothetical protein